MKKKDLMKLMEGISITANNVLSATSGKAESADGTNVSSAQGIGGESSSNSAGSGSFGKSESASFQNANSTSFGTSESISLTNILTEPGSVDIKLGSGGDINITIDDPADDERGMEFGKSLWEQNKDMSVIVVDSAGQEVNMSSTGVQAVQTESDNNEPTISINSPKKNTDQALDQAKKIKKNSPNSPVQVTDKDGNEVEIDEELDLSVMEIMSIVGESSNPMMTKNDLLSEVKRVIKEDMDPNVRRGIDDGSNQYSGKLGDELTKKFAQEHFEEIKQNLRNRGVDNVDLPNVQRTLMTAVMGAMELEGSHKEELEKLAADLIRAEYNIPEDAVDIQVDLVTPGTVNPRDIAFSKKETAPPEGFSSEELDAEVKKRRVTNSMMHGAARKGQNLYHMAREQVDDLDPSLTNHYNNLMAANDAMYWLLDDDKISEMGRMSDQHAGNVQVKFPEEGNPIIKAQGISFPILLHELAKGAMELISAWGTHEDEDVRNYVADQVDHLDAETDDIRFGPKLWEKFMETLDVDDLDIKSSIWQEIVSLPATEFNDLTNRMFKGEQSAKDEIKDIANEIKDDIGQEDMEDSLSQYRSDEPEEEEPAGDGREEEEYSDPELARLMSQQPEEEEGGYETWSQNELQTAMDGALDKGDFDTAREIGKYLR